MNPLQLLNPLMDSVRAGAMFYLPVVLALSGVIFRQIQNNIRDPLTGAYNRAGLTRKRIELKRRAKLFPNDEVAIISIDLNKFKDINDTYGHEAGDLALKHFAKALSSSSKLRTDAVVRLGGDEFVALLCAPKGKQTADLFIERVQKLLTEKPLRINHKDQEIIIPINFSAGVNVLKVSDIGNNRKFDAALNGADEGMYNNKSGSALCP